MVARATARQVLRDHLEKYLLGDGPFLDAAGSACEKVSRNFPGECNDLHKKTTIYTDYALLTTGGNRSHLQVYAGKIKASQTD